MWVSTHPCTVGWRGFLLAYIFDTCIKGRWLWLWLCGLSSLFCLIGLHGFLGDSSILSFVLRLCSKAWDPGLLLRTGLAIWNPVLPCKFGWLFLLMRRMLLEHRWGLLCIHSKIVLKAILICYSDPCTRGGFLMLSSFLPGYVKVFIVKVFCLHI